MPRQHFLESFEVWCEGFESSDGRGTALFMGKFNAESFAGACCQAVADHSYLDKDNLRYWGCRLFDNEIDARKSFG